MTNKFNSILIHLDWIRRGYNFNDILLIQNGLKDADPFSNAGAVEIQKHLGGYIDPSEEITQSDAALVGLQTTLDSRLRKSNSFFSLV